jgi:hypothetical protein
VNKMKKENLSKIKKHVEKIALYSNLEKLLNNQGFVKIAFAGGQPSRGQTQQLIQSLDSLLNALPPNMSNYANILNQMKTDIQQSNVQSTGQPPAGQPIGGGATGANPNIPQGTWGQTSAPQGQGQAATPQGQSGQSGQTAPNQQSGPQPNQTQNIQQAFQSIAQLGQNFLGASNRQNAERYPGIYQLVNELQQRLATLMGRQIDISNLDIQSAIAAYQSIPPMQQQAIDQLINQANQQINQQMSNLQQGGPTNVDNAITFLRNTALNKPVTVVEPGGHGRPTPAVLVEAKPNRVTLQTSKGRTISFDRNNPQFEEFVNNIKPLTWQERANPVTQLKSKFHEKKKTELTKLADKLDLMGHKKQAQRVDKLIQKIS